MALERKEEGPGEVAADQAAGGQAPAQALALKWAFGFNKERVGAVHNLSDDSRNVIFYFAAHTGVLYDYVQRKQTLLQGHCNPITCCAVSADKRWIATADEGPDSMIVIWDSLSGVPIKTIFTPHENGVKSMDMSQDAMFLITLSSTTEGAAQQVAVWEWTVDHDGALYRATCPHLPCKGSTGAEAKVEVRAEQQHDRLQEQCEIRFNGEDIQEFATTGKDQVVFWSWASKELQFQLPAQLSVADFGPKVGRFTQTVFLPGSMKAVSGTTEGNLVLWDTLSGSEDAGGQGFEAKNSVAEDMPRRTAVKVVKLNRHGSIPFLTLQDDLLVVCGQDESVRFYDMDFRIVAWFEDLDSGPVISVSFSNASNHYFVAMPVNDGSDDARDAGTDGTAGLGKPKSVKHALSDFVVSTSNALIVGVDAATFDAPSAEDRHGSLLLQGFDAPIAALCTHTRENVMVAASQTGVLQAWDFDDNRLLVVKALHPDDHPTCVAFSPDGSFLSVGFANGMLRILRWGQTRDLAEIACFCIHEGVGYHLVAFSSDGSFMALADSNNAVSLFRFLKQDVIGVDGKGFDGVHNMRVDQGKRHGEAGPGMEPCDGSDSRNGWTYIGRYKSHEKAVASIDFGVSLEGDMRCFSVGKEGTLVEYDLDRSSVVDGVRLVSEPKQIEFGDAVPMCCFMQPRSKSSREDLILVTNSEFKIKQLNANNLTNRKTTLGPTFGGPLTSMAMLDNKDSAELQYIAYCTEEKVIGLMKLPLDGNPFKSMGLIAHPGEISGFAPSGDGRVLVSAGGADLTVNVWNVVPSALDASSIVADSGTATAGFPKSLVSFMPLIDGGAEGKLFQEIVDYFYYAQIRTQGEDTTSPRRTEGTIPLSEIPNLMRALGFYPTEQQVADMCAEVRYSEFAATAQTVDTINLEQFIKLYVNHRPVMGVSLGDIDQAFDTIKRAVADKVGWKTLQNLLQEHGERMEPAELQSCLNMLLGTQAAAAMRPGAEMGAQSFASDVLGLEAPPDSSRRSHK
ncbi:Cilia- and flagella-associated protein 251 [Durusdinium trenchii]|uniref:Cilia- and flagella-associated protein 251 n=1 Tax=Durusdinium trenchii TaxID=1381693 RepID=A0ABP0L5T1_9DINO